MGRPYSFLASLMFSKQHTQTIQPEAHSLTAGAVGSCEDDVSVLSILKHVKAN